MWVELHPTELFPREPHFHPQKNAPHLSLIVYICGQICAVLVIQMLWCCLQTIEVIAIDVYATGAGYYVCSRPDCILWVLKFRHMYDICMYKSLQRGKNNLSCKSGILLLIPCAINNLNDQLLIGSLEKSIIHVTLQ